MFRFFAPRPGFGPFIEVVDYGPIKELFSLQKVAREYLLRLAHCGTGKGHQRNNIDSFGIKNKGSFVGGNH